MNRTKLMFYCLLAVVTIVLGVLFALYFVHFHGPLSDDSADWSNFSIFVSSIVTMCLTALNVWIFFSLTSEVAKKNDYTKMLDLKFAVQKQFRKTLYAVFEPDEENCVCEYNVKLLSQANELLLSLRSYSKIMKVCGTEQYDSFLNEYYVFCTHVFHDDELEAGQYRADIRSYELLQKGRAVLSNMTNEIADYMES